MGRARTIRRRVVVVHAHTHTQVLGGGGGGGVKALKGLLRRRRARPIATAAVRTQWIFPTAPAPP